MRSSPWILAVAPATALLACGALYWFSTRPQLAEGDRVTEEIHRTRREAEDRRAAVQDAGFFVRCEARPVEAAMKALDRIVGPEQRLNHFFPLISDLARKAGVRLTTCGKGRQEQSAPGSAEPGAESGPPAASAYAALMVSIGAEGPPEKLLEFIDSLESEFRPITVTEATIRRHEDRLLEATVMINARFVIRGAS